MPGTSVWPTDPLKTALSGGDTEIIKLCKELGVYSNVTTAEIVLEFSKFENGCAAGPQLSKLGVGLAS